MKEESWRAVNTGLLFFFIFWKLMSNQANKHTHKVQTGIVTIEGIEKDYWGDKPDYDSHLVTTIFRLRKKNLDEFTTEDLRIVIGQNRSLPILIPLAFC